MNTFRLRAGEENGNASVSGGGIAGVSYLDLGIGVWINNGLRLR